MDGFSATFSQVPGTGHISLTADQPIVFNSVLVNIQGGYNVTTGTHPLRVQGVARDALPDPIFQSHAVLGGKMAKIIGWYPNLWGWCPCLGNLRFATDIGTFKKITFSLSLIRLSRSLLYPKFPFTVPWSSYIPQNLSIGLSGRSRTILSDTSAVADSEFLEGELVNP